MIKRPQPNSNVINMQTKTTKIVNKSFDIFWTAFMISFVIWAVYRWVELNG